MKCPHCGVENAENSIFCSQCNKWILAEVYTQPEIPAQKTPAEKPAAKKSNLKFIIPTIAVLCAVILGVALLLPGPENPDPTTLPPAINTTISNEPTTAPLPPTTRPPEVFSVYHTGRGHIEPFNNGGKIGFFYDGIYMFTDMNYAFYIPENFSLNGDGYTGAYLTRDGQLLYLHAGEIRTVAEDVLSYELSASGVGLVYMGKDRKLYLYNRRMDMSKCLTTNISYNIGKDYAVSPDGEAVAFLVPDSAGGNSAPLSLYLYRDETVTNLEVYYPNTAHIIAVANGGTCVFMQESLVLQCVTEDGGEIMLGATMSMLDDLTAYVKLNLDHRQMMFHSFSGTNLVETDVRNTVCFSGQLTLLRPGFLSQNGFTDNAWTGLNDLVEGYYYSYRETVTLWKFPSDGTAQQIADCSAISLTANEKYIYYTDTENTLWRMDAKSQEAHSLADNVSSFWPNFDGSQVYYVCENMLYYCDGDGLYPPVRITEVPEKVKFYVTRDSWLYYLDGDKLYWCNPVWNFGLALEGVESCKLGMDGRLYVYTQSNGTYVSQDFGGFSPLFFESLDEERYREFT